MSAPCSSLMITITCTSVRSAMQTFLQHSMCSKHSYMQRTLLSLVRTLRVPSKLPVHHPHSLALSTHLHWPPGDQDSV
ncbi:hypothetical protein BC629DRAFT_1492061 [Irpex lacteus]|nr:hypothetical protein BC629DRAFT_1492061 [Irpex lacteus]